MVSEEELQFDLDSLIQLQAKRKATISRLRDAIELEGRAYDEREKIISVLRDGEQTDIVVSDLELLMNEQSKRSANIAEIQDTINAELEAMSHEIEIIEAIRLGDKS